MKKERFFELLNSVDEDLLLSAEDIKPKQKVWVRWIAAAACFCLIIGGAVTAFLLRGSDPDQPNPPQPPSIADPNHKPIILDATVAPDQLTGSSLEFVVGDSMSADHENASVEVPRFDFLDRRSIAVKAKAVKNLPDIYMPGLSSTYAFRVIEMETLEVLHGENVPGYFLYVIPEDLFVDMTVYDSLLISMEQLGTENYVLKNGTKNQIEAFPLPVFRDYQKSPDLGGVIAFTDGVFDESLWQTESWHNGYGYAKVYLDDPEGRDLIVFRGGTEDEAIATVKTRVRELIEREGEGYKTPRVITWNFSSEAANAVLDYVKPFQNGVFVQDIYAGALHFTRYINGCETEETVTIDLKTENVTYSGVHYAKEDMTCLEDIASHIAEKAKDYAEQIPTPPHIDPEDKKLLSLYIYGWYAKADGKVYGILQTVWKYEEEDGRHFQYYDESFILYDAAGTAQNISRDDLVSLVGERRSIYLWEYDEPYLFAEYA